MNLDVWRWLATDPGEVLAEAAAKAEHPSVADMMRLRKMASGDMVAAALDLAKARRKAVFKFGERAATLVADPVGVEMASSAAAGAWKAARFKSAFPRGRVLDLCCGIGGDAMALVAAGLDVLPVDADPVRAWMAGMNARCPTECRDAAEVAARTPGAFHLDPARRDGSGARAWTLDELVPGPEVIRGIIDACVHGAIKLAPGIDFAAVAARFGTGEVEIISEAGRLTQAVLWCGVLSRADGLRTATLLSPRPTSLTMSGPADTDVPIAEIDAYLAEPDDSVERAELLGQLCAATGAAMIHPRLGLLTKAQPIESPWVRGFRVLEIFPWNERRSRDVLKRHNAGHVEVKTRGKAVNPDELQPALSSKAGEPTVLFVLRFGRELRAIVARRVPGGGVTVGMMP